MHIPRPIETRQALLGYLVAFGRVDKLWNCSYTA